MDPQERLAPADFATKVKEKHPEYQDVDDLELSRRIVSKYPDYAPHVNLPSFEDTYKELNDTFTKQYGRGLDVTGDDTPQHRQGGKVGRAKDIRTKDLAPDQVDFLRSESGKRGFKMFDYSGLSGSKTLPSGMTITGPHLHIEYPDGVGSTSAAPIAAPDGAADGTAGSASSSSPSKPPVNKTLARSSVGLPAQTVAPVGEFNFGNFGTPTAEIHPEAIKQEQARKAHRIAPRSRLMTAPVAEPTSFPQPTLLEQANAGRDQSPVGLPPVSPESAEDQTAGNERRTAQSALATMPPVQRIMAQVGSSVIGGAGRTIGDTLAGIGKYISSDAQDTVAQAMEAAGHAVSRESTGIKERAGVPGIPGKVLEEAGGTAPLLLLPGGAGATALTRAASTLLPLALQQVFQASGEGASPGEAIKRGLTTAAAVGLGGPLGKAFGSESGTAAGRYLGRAAGIGAGFQAVNVATEGKLDAGSALHDAIFGLVFAAHGGRETPENVEAYTAKILASPDDAQHIAGVLHLDSEASPRASAGSPETTGDRDVSQGQPPSERVVGAENLPVRPAEQGARASTGGSRDAETGGRVVQGEVPEQGDTSRLGRGLEPVAAAHGGEAKSQVQASTQGVDEDYKFSSTQVNLPKDQAEPVLAMGKSIPDADLAADGREETPHITVKYGLHTSNADEVRSLLAGEKPIKVTLGKTKVFEGVEGGTADAVVAEVDSPDLHRLNKKIAGALEHTDTYPDYKPHVTIAYVKPGLGKKYAGRVDLEGKTVTLNEITFSGKDKSQTAIPLEGTSEPGQHHSAYQSREDTGTFSGPPEYPEDDPRGGVARRQTEITDAKSLANAFREAAPHLSEEETNAAAQIADARAETWAKQTKKDKSEWYKTRIAGVERGGEPGGSYIGVFETTQIKSATGNRGTFDPNDPNILAQSAWHGSPYHFDKFTLEHIGSGEGAQAYGWGLYFAGERKVAEFYRDKLGPGRGANPRDIATRILESLKDKPNADELAIKELERRKADAEKNSKIKTDTSTLEFDPWTFRSRMDEAIRSIRDGSVHTNLYKVDLKPKEDEYLLWDKPLSEQSDKVKAALDNIPEAKRRVETASNEHSASTMYQALGGDRRASETLRDAGIHGIKYLDQSSRTAGEGSYNYVIFDDADIAIEQILHQRKKGATQFLSDNRAVVHAYESADVSTFAHEIGHIFRRDLEQSLSEALPEHRDQIQSDIHAAETWAGVKDGNWNREHEEQWARGVEHYLRNGEAPTKELQPVFDRFKEWLTNIYQKIKGGAIDVKLSPEIRGVFDRMLGGEKAPESTSNEAPFSVDSAREIDWNSEASNLHPRVQDDAPRIGQIFADPDGNREWLTVSERLASGDFSDETVAQFEAASRQSGLSEHTIQAIIGRARGESAPETFSVRRAQAGEPSGVSARQAAPQENQTGQLQGDVTSPAPPTGIKNSTGIARRVEESRRGQGIPDSAEGIGAQESVENGRKLLREGHDPQDVVDDFKKTGAVSADAMALVRAKHEELARAANNAFDEGGLNSPKFKAAEKARQDFWETSVRPIQTAWSNTGRAQQGETAIDTGTFYGIYRAFKQETGREMTPREQAAAKRFADRVATGDRGVRDIEQRLIARLNNATGIEDLGPDLQKALGRFVQESRREARTQKRQATKKTLDEEAVTIKSNLAVAFQKLSQGGGGIHPSGLAGLDPEGEITKFVLQYAKNRVKAGIVDAAQLVDDVHAAIKEFADVGKREIAEVLAGLGTSRGTRDTSDWMKAKGEIRKGVKAEDAEQQRSDIGKRLAAGERMKPEDVKAIWRYANDKYIDKGVEFGDTVQKLASDLGATPDQVRRALATQAGVKPLTDEVYRKMSARRQVKSAAERWVKNADRSPGLKAAQGLADAFFNLKTFGHGTVGPVTHAGENIFHPSRWTDYFKNVGRTWRAAYSTAAHERYMQDLLNDPNYTTARRAGLANEPGKFYDEYQNTLAQKMFGAVGKIGNRGFDILKTMRQDFFNQRWGRLEESQKTPEMAKAIADLVNHSTGAISSKLPAPNLTRGIFFAAPLEASRWARILGDPTRAVDAFINWKSATSADKYFAKSVMKNHAEFVATYVAALALNQAILAVTKSDDKVNFTDPSKGDWLRLKVKGRTIEPTGGLISTLDFLGKLGQAALGAQNPREGRFERMGQAATRYVRGKLSPLASTVTDVASQSDFLGRPLPFSSDKERAGKPRYSWPEYLITQQTPIPIAEAARDFFDEMHKQGVPLDTTKAIFRAAWQNPKTAGKGFGIGIASGGTGVRIGTEYSQVPQKSSRSRGSKAYSSGARAVPAYEPAYERNN